MIYSYQQRTRRNKGETNVNASNGNMAEYTVERKATGKYLKYKIGCLALYAAIVLGYLCTTVALSTYGVWVAVVIIPFVPLFIMLLRHYVWNRYVNVEYKYEIVSANIIFYEVYGKQRQNKIYERLISEFDLIAPPERRIQGQVRKCRNRT